MIMFQYSAQNAESPVRIFAVSDTIAVKYLPNLRNAKRCVNVKRKQI